MYRLCRTIMQQFLAVFILLSSASSVYAADSDTLMLLLPDGMAITDQRVIAWKDTAREEGVQLKIIRDTEFQVLGSAALKYRGLVLPDGIHVNASDDIIAAINAYVNAGGNVMLIYDFGALTENGFYAVPKSRLSALAGVDYVLYDKLRENTVGLGHVTGMESALWKLGVPPGKSMPYNTLAIANTADPVAASLAAQVATETLSDEGDYLYSNAQDPGGLKGYDHGRFFRSKRGDAMKRLRMNQFGDYDRYMNSKVFRGKKKWQRFGRGKPRFVPATPTDEIQGISGYVYGFLTYPSFVAEDLTDSAGNIIPFAGEVVLDSPNYGMVAGVNQVGKGKVLFVNLPLTYLKGQTDGMLMHGFVRYFAADMLKMPVLAKMPDAKGGLVLNWHVDDAQAIDAIASLDKYGVWKEGPCSMHFTAGPDVDVVGDGLGMDLPNNKTAQNWMKYLDKKGHQIAAHGGWIHNYYGLNANETNESDFMKYLVWNRDAVVNVIRRPLTEYSAPQGNNPSWSLDWLESQGILGYYTGGDTGMSFTRLYKYVGDNMEIPNPKMWAFPVTPFGPVATFEEFMDLGWTDAQILPWYQKIADFSAVNRSSFLIYMHPPGAINYPTTVVGLLNRGKQLASNIGFNWYTITDLSRFAQRHLDTVWDTSQSSDGTVTFTATHPDDLSDMTWLLPIDVYSKPRIIKGKGSVTQDGNNYVVTATKGNTLVFSAKSAF